ncbi:MAG TPA: hypothetical protein VFD63_09805, partial [Pyrinomonadaceae bacterium]|nr:hypothetical protein [Pyrinomonadaceae bacterium]
NTKIAQCGLGLNQMIRLRDGQYRNAVASGGPPVMYLLDVTKGTPDATIYMKGRPSSGNLKLFYDAKFASQRRAL